MYEGPRGTHIWIGGGVPLEAQNPYPYLVIFLKESTHF